jgi:hypothetical protein
MGELGEFWLREGGGSRAVKGGGGWTMHRLFFPPPCCRALPPPTCLRGWSLLRASPCPSMCLHFANPPNRVLGIPEATKSFPEGSPHIGAHSDSSDATVVFEVDSRVVNVTLPSIEGGGGGGGGGFSQSVYQRAQRGSLQPTPRIAEHFMHAQRCVGRGGCGVCANGPEGCGCARGLVRPLASSLEFVVRHRSVRRLRRLKQLVFVCDPTLRSISLFHCCAPLLVYAQGCK